MTRTVAIVGASVAGVRTAQALRSEHFDGRVLLVGDEPHLPYDKPPLSKSYLTEPGNVPDINLAAVDDLVQADIELILSDPAVALDPANKRLTLRRGTTIEYDDLAIATGARARPSPWQVPGIVHLRSLDDATGLRERLAVGGSVVIIGGGLIGSEVAAAASARGCGVTIVDPVELPMERITGTDIARRMVELHRERGVSTRLGSGVEDVAGAEGEYKVTLTDGTVLAATTVVVGIGSVPNDSWLAGSGAPLRNGVVCDGHLLVEGLADVHAVGDVARWPHPRRGEMVRAEHWTNAVEQARYVAKVIAGTSDGAAFDPSDYVWSDQYDWKLQAVGVRHPAGATRLVGSLEGERPMAVAVHESPDGVATGGAALNWPRGSMALRRMVGTATVEEIVSAVRSL